MSNEQQLENQLSKYKIITDKKIIEELNKQELYIAPNETEETFDQDIISGTGHDLKTSSGKVGQLRAIEVAVWFDDPNKSSDNSIDRIHLRIINGRHRYKIEPTWRREYYDFSGFVKEGKDPIVQFYFATGHFDMQKKATKEQRAVWVNDMCEHAMKKLGIPAQKCCNWVVEQAKSQGISSERAIREVCPKEFKDLDKVKSKEGMTFEKAGRETKEIKKLKKVAGEKYIEMEASKIKLETENTRLQKENIGLQEQANETQKTIADMQQQLRLVANIDQEAECECGKKTKIKVDASSGKLIISGTKGTAKLIVSTEK